MPSRWVLKRDSRETYPSMERNDLTRDATFMYVSQSSVQQKHVQLALRAEKRAIRELKQPRRRRQQERHKFAYLTMKNSSFARFARAFCIFGHLADVLDLSTT